MRLQNYLGEMELFLPMWSLRLPLPEGEGWGEGHRILSNGAKLSCNFRPRRAVFLNGVDWLCFTWLMIASPPIWYWRRCEETTTRLVSWCERSIPWSQNWSGPIDPSEAPRRIFAR